MRRLMGAPPPPGRWWTTGPRMQVMPLAAPSAEEQRHAAQQLVLEVPACLQLMDMEVLREDVGLPHIASAGAHPDPQPRAA